MKHSPLLSLDALEFSKTAGAQRSGFGKDFERFAGGPSRFPPQKVRRARASPPSNRPSFARSLRDSRRQVLENSSGGSTRLRNRQTSPLAAKLPLPDGNQGSRRLPSEADSLIFPLPSNFILNQHGPSCFFTSALVRQAPWEARGVCV